MVSVVTLILVTVFFSFTAGKQENRIALESIDCFCFAPLCANASCSMIKHSIFKYELSLRAVITRAQPKVIMRLRKYFYTTKKTWKLSNININIDYCDFAKGAHNPVMNLFVPNIREKVGSMLRQCPYVGEFYVKNYTLEMGKNFVSTPKGTKLKVEVAFLTGKLVPVFGIIFYNEVV